VDAVKAAGGEVDAARTALCAYLAQHTEGFSGADLVHLTREAGMIALRRDLHAQHLAVDCFTSALDAAAPSLLHFEPTHPLR
jgi:SpoVK/Ycf46/Vps4 family AAA+-type ATPase